jgi:dolichol kinase
VVSAPPAAPGRPAWRDEVRRKAIHLYALLVPLAVLQPFLPWPRTRGEWSLFLGALTLTALAIDMVRLNNPGVRALFKRFLGGMIREHEDWSLLGSTYLLIAALLAVDVFPRPLAGAALGFTVLGDAFAAMVGRVWGRRRLFGKTLEGAAAGLAADLAWVAWLAATGLVPAPVGVAGALVASLVELLPIPLDDNLGITLASGLVMTLMWRPA